jgi:lipopolysaccharide export LptBFGC system permease protein LptF
MYVDELAGKGLDFKILSELLYHFALTFVPTALPLGILLASLMTFGNMGEFSELSALKSSGNTSSEDYASPNYTHRNNCYYLLLFFK